MYELTAAVPQAPADRNLTVRAALSLKNVSTAPATTLTLRISPNADITGVTANGSTVDHAKREERIAGGTLQRASIRLPAAAPGSTVNVVVDYKLNVKENSGLNAISPTGSLFLPMSFWYPTPNSWFFARGADHAPFRLRVTVPAGTNAVSSGNEKSGTFEHTFPGQPFFATGNWDAVNADGVTMYLPRGSSADEQKRASEAAALANEAKAFFVSLLGPAPDLPIRLVAVRRGAGFAGGGTILVDEAAFRRPKLDSLTTMHLAESVARLWIGNAIGVTGDAQGVIREGLVRYLATEFIEKKFGKEIADVERLRQRAAYSLVARRDSPLTVVAPMDDFYYPAVANKGAMVWRLLAKRVGKNAFFEILRTNAQDKQLDLAELRAAFSEQRSLLDHQLDQVTDMNLLVGLPQAAGAETKVALRNTGGTDATVTVTATTVSGEKISAPTTIRAREFGEISFRNPQKITRVEVDSEKLYPQIDYSDDVAPREFTDSDVLLAVKRLFDKQDFAGAEKAARLVLRDLPRHDDVRILLGRSLLALNRYADAEREFRAINDELLPSARSMAWANVGSAQAAARASQTSQALKLAEDAIRMEAEYGASLAARNIRNSLGVASTVDEGVKSFFAAFDRAAAANRKAEIDALVLPGEAVRFASGISGQTEQWQTQVQRVDRIDANTMLVETNLSVKLLNAEPETGMAVFRLTRIDGAWKLSGVDIYEVR
jgi:hypothetical protein